MVQALIKICASNFRSTTLRINILAVDNLQIPSSGVHFVPIIEFLIAMSHLYPSFLGPKYTGLFQKQFRRITLQT